MAGVLCVPHSQARTLMDAAREAAAAAAPSTKPRGMWVRRTLGKGVGQESQAADKKASGALQLNKHGKHAPKGTGKPPRQSSSAAILHGPHGT